MEPLLIRVEEAARVLGISRSKAYVLVADGRLPVVKIDRSTRVRVADLERFVTTGPQSDTEQ